MLILFILLILLIELALLANWLYQVSKFGKNT